MFAALGATQGTAQSAATVPVAAVRVTLAAGTPASPVVTPFAIPLDNIRVGAGSRVGRIASRNGDALIVAGANWTPGELARVEAPYAARILTGAASGHVFPIASNTATTAELLAAELADVTLAIGAQGELVEIFPVETLNTLFGAQTLIGGASAAGADVVYLGGRLQDGFYFNTTHHQWRRAHGRATADSGHMPVLPHAVIQVSRVGPALTLTFTGRAPSRAFRVPIARAGNTYTHSGFPTEITLSSLALDRRVADWASAASGSLADRVLLPIAGRWEAFYHNGSNWVDAARGAVHDDVVIAAGTPMIIGRPGTSAGVSTFVRPLPYSLTP